MNTLVGEEIYLLYRMDSPDEDEPKTVVVAVPVLERTLLTVKVKGSRETGFRTTFRCGEFYPTVKAAVEAFKEEVWQMKLRWEKGKADLREMKMRVKR
jgi:hypothetical protein